MIIKIMFFLKKKSLNFPLKSILLFYFSVAFFLSINHKISVPIIKYKLCLINYFCFNFVCDVTLEKKNLINKFTRTHNENL